MNPLISECLFTVVVFNPNMHSFRLPRFSFFWVCSVLFFFILLLLAKRESNYFCSLSIYLEHIRCHISRIHLLCYEQSLSVLSIHFQMPLLSQQKVKYLTIFGLQNAKAVFLNNDCELLLN